MVRPTTTSAHMQRDARALARRGLLRCGLLPEGNLRAGGAMTYLAAPPALD